MKLQFLISGNKIFLLNLPKLPLQMNLDEKLPKLDILLNEQNYMGAMEAINSFVPGLNNFLKNNGYG